MSLIEKLQGSAGAHIHTANKAKFYRDFWAGEEDWNRVTELDKAVDQALAGDWKPLQNLLRNLW